MTNIYIAGPKAFVDTGAWIALVVKNDVFTFDKHFHLMARNVIPG